MHDKLQTVNSVLGQIIFSLIFDTSLLHEFGAQLIVHSELFPRAGRATVYLKASRMCFPENRC